MPRAVGVIPEIGKRIATKDSNRKVGKIVGLRWSFPLILKKKGKDYGSN